MGASWRGDMMLRHTGAMTQEELVAAAKAYRRAERIADQRKQELFDEIRAAYNDPSIKTVTIAEITGFTREHVRRIVKSQ